MCHGLKPLTPGMWCCSAALLHALVPLTERSEDRDSPPQANLSVTDDFVGFGYPTLATRSGRQHFEVTLKSGVGGVESEGSVQLG